MTTHKITLIPGDGTGPEIVEATRRAIEATGVQIEWDRQEIGVPAIEKYGTPFPQAALDSIRKNKVGLKGPLTTELGKGFRSVNVALRKEFDLYANLRPAKTYPGVRTPMGDVDLVVVRENIEDLYAGIEFDLGTPELAEVRGAIEKAAKTKMREDAAISIKYISEMGSRRIVRFAFEYAVANGRKKVTAVHKANVMKFTDGLFLRIIGENGVAVFEAIHGSAPKYAGQNKVNPMALMLAGALMLRHIDEREAGDRLERAIAAVVAEGRDVTYDLKPQRDDPTAVGTKEFADAVIRQLAAVHA